MKLKHCPFCGGEAHVNEHYSFPGYERTGIYPDYLPLGYTVGCSTFDCRGKRENSGFMYETEAEAIAAWNSRAPIEYDGWFYLPKPKEGIVVYGEPEITRTENGYKVRQIADVVDEAARRWGEELGEYVMKRICEVWNSRAERMCRDVSMDSSTQFYCSECECTVEVPLLWGEINYCPNCGCKVVGE